MVAFSEMCIAEGEEEKSIKCHGIKVEQKKVNKRARKEKNYVENKTGKSLNMGREYSHQITSVTCVSRSMENSERKIFMERDQAPCVWKRFVDSLLAVVKRNYAYGDKLLKLNSAHA